MSIMLTVAALTLTSLTIESEKCDKAVISATAEKHANTIARRDWDALQGPPTLLRHMAAERGTSRDAVLEDMRQKNARMLAQVESVSFIYDFDAMTVATVETGACYAFIPLRVKLVGRNGKSVAVDGIEFFAELDGAWYFVNIFPTENLRNFRAAYPDFAHIVPPE